jgi:regulator of protease activity HflC (stomatin/prohibitin superfamily)
MMPVLVSVAAACWMTASFLQTLYGLKSRGEGWNSLVYSLIGLQGFRPYLVIKEGAIQGDENHMLRRIGGPGGLIVYGDSAAVLEKGGKLTRVLKPGFHYAERFEKVWDVVDLRPQRWNFEVKAMTREGIPVTCHADIGFKIDDGGQEPTDDVPYPATEEAILKAATAKWIREVSRTEPDRLMTWTKRVMIGQTEGVLRTILSRYPLDQMIDPVCRRAIKQKLEEDLREAVRSMGTKITRAALGDVKVEDEVTQQWIEKWQTEGKRRIMELEAEGKAKRFDIETEARTQAQIQMIVNTARAFDRMSRQNKDIPSRFLILRFIETMRHTSTQLLGEFYTPQNMVETLDELKRMIEGRKEGDIIIDAGKGND